MNENQLTMNDIKNYYIEKFIEKGYVKTKKQATDLLIDCLIRNIVINEVESMACFITDEERWYREYN